MKRIGGAPWRLALLSAALLGTLVVQPAAQPRVGPMAGEEIVREPVVPEALKAVDVDEQLGEKIPLDLAFTTSDGQEVTLAELMSTGKPAVLNLVYHECPMLCSLVLDGTTAALKEIDLDVGADFDVLTVSFSTGDTPEMAAEQKAKYVERYGRAGASDGWHFLVGEQESIEALTAAAGFGFRWDRRAEQYAHPAVLVMISPDGTITRYLYGIEFPPFNVRTAILEAGQGTVGSTVDKLILYCFQYDPEAGSYTPQVMNMMKLGGLLFLLIGGGAWLLMWRREAARQTALIRQATA
ncbi:MAG: SCO family protein [Bacteroidota bacterium]